MTADGRCVATNPAGARCILSATHGNDHHAYATDAYRLGKLQAAVTLFLAGEVDRDFLARTLAETEGEAG